MPEFISTSGRTKIAIAICGRCSRKFPYSDLVQDPNNGLWVCPEDQDVLDPYRLPARESENISLEHPRPDVPISTPGPTYVYANEIANISAIGFATPWRASMPYVKGASITPLDVNLESTTLPQQWLLCTTAGTSGATHPVWPTTAGVVVHDGSAIWLSLGIFPN